MKTALKVFLVALAIPTIMGMSDEMQELANQLHTTCIGETGAAEDAITNARNGDFSEADSFKCYIKCLLSQMAIKTSCSFRLTTMMELLMWMQWWQFYLKKSKKPLSQLLESVEASLAQILATAPGLLISATIKKVQSTISSSKPASSPDFPLPNIYFQTFQIM
ncbi:hypothetical protein D910_10850 [Dendroctonus ponderosae]